MKNDNKKIYEKALKFYNNGEIEKAIQYCEKGISNSLKDSKILNLKGLLLYTKGELNEATTVWKINKDYNNDSIAKAYLEDSRNDIQRLHLCREAESLIDNLYIDEALENLIECSKSDFNLIEVNNLMALAYMKKGQYDNSRICLQKVLNIDKDNFEAKERIKEINDLLEIKSKKGVLFGFLGVLAIIIAAILLTYKLGILHFDFNGKGIKEIITFNPTGQNNNEVEDNNKYEENKSNNGSTLEDYNKELKNEETKIEESEEKSVEEKKKEEAKEEVKNLTKAEIQKNYSEGIYYFKIKEYDEAIRILEETKNSEGISDLHDDILFFLAASYQSKQIEDKAIENFELFVSKYPKGSYSEEAFYKLILLYENKDINISKKYAKQFTEIYPNSIYYNNEIYNILNR